MSRAPETVAVRWLIDAGVWLPDAGHAENMQRCAAARAKWGARLGAEPGKAWARAVLDRYRAGKPLPMEAVRMAMAALGMPQQPVLRTPGAVVSRPDRKDMAAGDVEVTW